MGSRLKYTQTADTYYRVSVYLIVYSRLFAILLHVLVCYKSNIRIWVNSGNVNLTVNTL